MENGLTDQEKMFVIYANSSHFVNNSLMQYML